MGERRNLADACPDRVADLRAEAEAWRVGIESRWENEWQSGNAGTTTHPTR